MAMRYFCLLMCMASVALCVQKRSDDTSYQSLETLVQQQAATIQQLQAFKAATEARLTSLEATDHRQTTMLDSRVAFTAFMTAQPVNVGTSNHPFVFNHVVTNIANGYNPQTGVFTSPLSGLYVFYAQLMNHVQHGYMVWGIYTGNALLCQNFLEPSNTHDKSSCEATVHVQKGETVVVRRQTGDNTDQVIEGGRYVSFTGFLLSADAA